MPPWAMGANMRGCKSLMTCPLEAWRQSQQTSLRLPEHAVRRSHVQALIALWAERAWSAQMSLAVPISGRSRAGKLVTL